MKGKGIVVAVLLITALFAMVMPAEAKTYYWFYDHWAVRYEHNEIASSLQPYVDKVEYDLAYSGGNGYGVRLYLTSFGKELIKNEKNHYLLYKATDYVGTRPEFRTDRSYSSVATEVLYHTKVDRQIVYIDYYYQDMKWWEKLFYG